MNSNILEGWKCPECGNEDSFRVEVSGMALVTDNGCDVENAEWTADSFAVCVQCDYDSIAETFSGAGR